MRWSVGPGVLYGSFYFCFFAFQSVNRSFFPLHCKHILGLSDFQIAVVTASEDFANMFGPPLVLHLAHTWLPGRRLSVWGSLFAFLFFLPLFGTQYYLWVLVFWFACLLAARTPIVLTEAAAIRDSETRGLNYGRIRTWGSFGFVGLTFGVGVLMDIFGPQVILPSGLVLIAVLLSSSVFSRGVLRAHVPASDLPTPAPLRELFQSAQGGLVVRFLAVVSLLWASHAVLFTYLSLHLESLGWSGTMISAAWGMSVGAELFVFYYFEQLQARFSLTSILRFSLCCAVLRWSILGSTESAELILGAQTLHSFSLIGFHVAAMKMMFEILPEPYRDRGQGLLAAAGIGFGVFVGRMLAGIGASALPDELGFTPLFWGGAVLTLVALLLSLSLPRVSRKTRGESASVKQSAVAGALE